MKPAPFDYTAPATIDEAVALLAARGEDAKILAGGQSLVPMMNFRLVRPACLIDINRIDGLAGITRPPVSPVTVTTRNPCNSTVALTRLSRSMSSLSDTQVVSQLLST